MGSRESFREGGLTLGFNTQHLERIPRRNHLIGGLAPENFSLGATTGEKC